LPRPTGSIGKHNFYTPETLSNSYITRHMGYNVFANNDNSIDETCVPLEPIVNNFYTPHEQSEDQKNRFESYHSFSGDENKETWNVNE